MTSWWWTTAFQLQRDPPLPSPSNTCPSIMSSHPVMTSPIPLWGSEAHQFAVWGLDVQSGSVCSVDPIDPEMILCIRPRLEPLPSLESFQISFLTFTLMWVQTCVVTPAASCSDKPWPLTPLLIMAGPLGLHTSIQALWCHAVKKLLTPLLQVF